MTGLTPAEVAVGGTLGPTKIQGVVPNREPAVVAEVDPLIEPELPHQERVSTNWLGEGEADVAGGSTSEPHWFWELLEAAGYDVW